MLIAPSTSRLDNRRRLTKASLQDKMLVSADIDDRAAEPKREVDPAWVKPYGEVRS